MLLIKCKEIPLQRQEMQGILDLNQNFKLLRFQYLKVPVLYEENIKKKLLIRKNKRSKQ